MTDAQLYLAIRVPILVNAAALGIVATLLMHHANAQIGSLLSEMNTRFEGTNQGFAAINQRFAAINQRFDDMRDLWRAELHRVEEVLDARLKHLEER